MWGFLYMPGGLHRREPGKSRLVQRTEVTHHMRNFRTPPAGRRRNEQSAIASARHSSMPVRGGAESGRHRTRTFRPADLLEPGQDPKAFGPAGLRVLKLDPNLEGIDGLQAVAATLWQHLVVARIHQALARKRWSVEELARHTPGIGSDSWHNVINGRTLIRSDHTGAALIALGDIRVLPSRKEVAEAKAHHERRLVRAQMLDEGYAWSQMPDLGEVWLELRHELRRPQPVPATGKQSAVSVGLMSHTTFCRVPHLRQPAGGRTGGRWRCRPGAGLSGPVRLSAAPLS